MKKLTIAQINPTIGDMEGNIELMYNAAKEAVSINAQMVVFPELSLTGYYPADLLDDAGFAQRLQDCTTKLIEATRKLPYLYWVVGVPTLNPGAGKGYFNSLLVLRNGAIELTYHKQLLPTYNVFDERRHFEPGPDVAPILRVDGARIGFLICEDGWNDSSDDYAVNPFARLGAAAPDLVVSINASPAHLGKREQRHAVFTSACARHKLPLVYVNQVGGHDQLVYDGASFAVSKDGQVVFEANRFEPHVVTLSFDTAEQEFTAAERMPLAPVSVQGLSKMEFYRRQIVLGLRDYARRCNFKKVVVGSSGGIDSALTLALAVEALGPENVAAITMPSQFSSEGSISDSQALCDNLGIRLDQVAIGDIVEQYGASMAASSLAEYPSGLALENLQARIRGTLLMAYSNMHGHLLLTTGNKSEISVGYCTLYGDTNGGLGLIGDLYKTEVFALCRHLNAAAGRELIPETILTKEPSAELSPDQKDTDSLPPYEVLDAILKVLIEGNLLSAEELADAAEVQQAYTPVKAGETWLYLFDKVKQMIARNEYKRQQSAPILRVRARAFGSGRQLPIAAKHY